MAAPRRGTKGRRGISQKETPEGVIVIQTVVAGNATPAVSRYDTHTGNMTRDHDTHIPRGGVLTLKKIKRS